MYQFAIVALLALAVFKVADLLEDFVPGLATHLAGLDRGHPAGRYSDLPTPHVDSGHSCGSHAGWTGGAGARLLLRAAG